MFVICVVFVRNRATKVSAKPRVSRKTTRKCVSRKIPVPVGALAGRLMNYGHRLFDISDDALVGGSFTLRVQAEEMV